jgi:hypothetical protein
MQTGPIVLTIEDINTLQTSKEMAYGTLGQTADGSLYRFVKFGGTSTIAPGLLVVGPAAPANSTGLAVTASGTGGQLATNLVAGSRTLVVTNGATAVTADQFQYLRIHSVADGEYEVKVAGNTAAAATTGYVTLLLEEPLPVGMTTLVPGTDTVDLVLSEYNGVAPSTTGNVPVGVSTLVVANTASVTYYGWVKSRGLAVVKATTGTIGLGVAQDQAGTAGYVIISAATTGNIGWFKTSASSNVALVKLNID